MRDAQLAKNIKIKNMLIASFLLIVISSGLGYFKFSTDAEVAKYRSDKAKEDSLQDQIDEMTEQNSQLQYSIDENGKELVSFTEDKIKYINLASELSQKYSVKLNKLAVSDVWSEGQMSVMTTSVEVDGDLQDIANFINEYCGANYTNRINIVSCRPIDRYPWLTRTIDGTRVISWFDLEEEQTNYETYIKENDTADISEGTENGTLVTPPGTTLSPATYITIDDMFASKTMRVYLQIDFLGRN